MALGALALANPSRVHALDCRKAFLPAEHLFCSTPELKRADAAVSAAHCKLLRETADPQVTQP